MILRCFLYWNQFQEMFMQRKKFHNLEWFFNLLWIVFSIFEQHLWIMISLYWYSYLYYYHLVTVSISCFCKLFFHLVWRNYSWVFFGKNIFLHVLDVIKSFSCMRLGNKIQLASRITPLQINSFKDIFYLPK